MTWTNVQDATETGDCAIRGCTQPAHTDKLCRDHLDRLGTARGLSPNMLAVLALSAEGLTSAEIAKLRYRSVGTIEAQRAAIIAQLGARNITHAIAIAFQTGLLS